MYILNIWIFSTNNFVNEVINITCVLGIYQMALFIVCNQGIKKVSLLL